MAYGFRSTDNIPAELKNAPYWAVVELNVVEETQSEIFPQDFNEKIDPEKAFEYSEALSIFQEAPDDRALTFITAGDFIVVDFHNVDPSSVSLHGDHSIIKRLDSFTETVQKNDHVRTYLKVPLSPGVMTLSTIKIHSGVNWYPLWHTKVADDIYADYDVPVREYSKREFFERLDDLNWFEFDPPPEPSSDDPERWIVAPVRAEKEETDELVQHDLSDIEVLRRAKSAPESGMLFTNLMAGDLDSVKMNRLKANQALMNLLAYWFCYDTAKMKQYFGKSGLAEPTLVHPDGTTRLERHIARALQFVNDCYDTDAPVEYGYPKKRVWHPDRMTIMFPDLFK